MAKDVRIKVGITDNIIPVKVGIGQTVIKTVGPETYTGPVTVTPTEEPQTLQTNGKLVKSNISVGAIPDEYIIPTGTEVISVTENGTVTADVTAKASVTINVDVPTAPVETDYDEVTLPSEYQRVEYIESSGTQYIDIPIGFEPTDEIYTALSMSVSTNANAKFMVAEKTWNTDNNRFSMGGTNDRNAKYFSAIYGNADSNATTLSHGYRNDGNIYTHKYKDYIFSVKELEIMCGVKGVTFGSKTSDIRLFYGYNSNTAGKIRYYVHTKADGTSVALYACYRKSDGVIGMYDTVNNVFYTNAGTGTFTKGADI